MRNAIAALVLAAGFGLGPTLPSHALTGALPGALAPVGLAVAQDGLDQVQWRRGGGWRRGYGGGWRRAHVGPRPGWRRAYWGPRPVYAVRPRVFYAGPRVVWGGPVCRTVWVEGFRPRLGGWVVVPRRICR